MKKLYFFLMFFVCVFADYYSTWLPAESDLSVNDKWCQSPQIAIGNNGTAICVWEINKGSGYRYIQAAYSEDGGNTWNPATTDLSDYISEDPQIVIDSNNRAICIWHRISSSSSYKRITQTAYSEDGGKNWSTPIDVSPAGFDSYDPQIAVDATTNRLICTWRLYDSGGSNKYIVQSAYSIDGGISWIQTSQNLSENTGSAYDNQITIDGHNRAFCVWRRQDPNDSNNYRVQVVVSIDGGINWSTPIDLSEAGKNAYDSQIATGDNLAVCVWRRRDSIDEMPHIQAAYSTDGGNTWIAANQDLSTAYAYYPKIAIDSNNHAICTWRLEDENDLSKNCIQIAYSANNGVDWSIPQNLIGFVRTANYPKLTIDSDNHIICVWYGSDPEDDPDQYYVQASYSLNGGISWIPSDDNLSEDDANAFYPVAAIASDRDADRAICVWSRENPDIPGAYVIQAAYSVFSDPIFRVRGRKDCKELLFHKDFVNVISWNLLKDAVYYRVYKDTFSPQHKVYEGKDSFFCDHGIYQNQEHNYYVTWINESGKESSPARIKITP